MRNTIAALVFCLTASALPCRAADAPPPINLAPDASFESPAGSWFELAGRGQYFAAMERVAAAADGKSVLAVQGWERKGSKILSAPLTLPPGEITATIDVRSFGAVDGATVELALFDEKGSTRVASFGKAAVDGKGTWATIASGTKLAAPAARQRLALILSGPQHGARVEFDRVGLFAAPHAPPVVDNADFQWFEAEELADGAAWKVVDHYPGWYADAPSNMKMLAGPHAIKPAAADKPVSKTLTVRTPGPHRLWARVMHTNASTRGLYTITLTQSAKPVASREVDNGDPALGPDYSWVWVSIDADLAAGPVEIALSRPPGEASWVARKLDLLALTNLLDYKPEIQDFRPQGYVRFTNQADGQEPFCLWAFVHRLQPPVYYVTPGVLSAAGFSGAYSMPDDKTKWLAPGESSPWVKLSDSLVAGGNLVTFIATRGSHTSGFVTGHVKGRLEFAAGDDRRVVRTVDVDLDAPRLLMTLPADFEHQPDEILTALDYVQRTETIVAKLPQYPGPPAKHLDLNAVLGLSAEIDDPRVVDREIAILKRLGFNGTLTPVAQPKDAAAFQERHGLAQHFGMTEGVFFSVKDGCQNQPDLARISAALKRQADTFAPVLDKATRLNVADEPGGMSYEHIAACPTCKTKFAQQLKAQNLTPRDLGAADWSEVVPVLPAAKHAHPELFYRTALFRLTSFADLAKTCVAEKRKFFPANVKTHVNYSPPANWVDRGTDVFLAQRDGGFEMGWCEDWLGYGAGPQQGSEIFALLRAAGPGQPLGAYAVGVSGSPLHMRIKLYELLAGGVRDINVYAYGPAYTGVDSWSTRAQIYPVVNDVLHEFANIDQPLHNTTRRRADLAILYNRTASIWAGHGSTPQQDSYFMRWALAHAGFDADFIPEEDVVAGRLADYKALYLTGPQLRADAAKAIAQWVTDGGVLFASAGAGSRDQHDRPLPTLDPVFGAKSVNLKLERDAGRPRYELITQPVLDEISSVDRAADVPAVRFNQLCFRESLDPLPGATVILHDRSGAPAGVSNAAGKGRAIRVAASPGLAYINAAVRGKDYDPDSYLPRAYPADLRDLITWPARLAGATPVATADTPLIEMTRYDAPDRAVLFLIDHNATPRRVTISLPDAQHFKRARTARGKPITTKPAPNAALELSLDLDTTDAIVLER